MRRPGYTPGLVCDDHNEIVHALINCQGCHKVVCLTCFEAHHRNHQRPGNTTTKIQKKPSLKTE